MIKKTITITPQQDAWIKSRIATGHYGNDSEFIRDLIRREQMRLEELEAVRTALAAGERSGRSASSAASIRKKARAKLKQDGHL